MKMKYFLRGLGIGIIFGAFIMLVAYMTSGKKELSDDEIMDRASKLGMVMGNDIVDNLEDNDTEGENKEEGKTSQVASDKTEEDIKDDTEDKTEDSSTEDKTTEGTTEGTTEATTESKDTTEATTEEDVATESENTDTYATITVSPGMSSSQVAKLLQDAGIIEDYLDFDQYLNANGYSTKIRVNTFKFKEGMTYKELAEELTKETAGQ